MCLVTGAITVTPVTPRYQVYDSNEEIYVEVQIRGEFYDIIWRYDASDPTAAQGSTLTINSGGVSGPIFRQRLRISTNSHHIEQGIMYLASKTHSLLVEQRGLTRVHCTGLMVSGTFGDGTQLVLFVFHVTVM